MHNFSQIVTGAIDIAQSQALEKRNPALEPIHLFYGLLKNPASISAQKLTAFNENVEKKLLELPRLESVNLDTLRPSAEFQKWITLASSNATKEGTKEIKEKHFLETITAILKDFKVKIGSLGLDSEDSEIPEFLTNLNELAGSGKLDPVVGRQTEIRAVMEILGRRRKNNPVLVGEAGVGKTAVLEGLAGLIVEGKVPAALKGKTVYSLDLGALMAGTKYRGEFEERLQSLLKFVIGQAGEVILFIDEIHQLVGAGKTDGAMDAANLLKPALARGELKCIGATTQDEFQKYIIQDSALERRFREVPILEPTPEDAIEILLGLKDKFEAHHGIEIADEALYSAVFLSKEYIPEKNLPDKAIDLVDEAAASIKLAAEAMPNSLVALESEIRSKVILSKTEPENEDLKQEIDELQSDFNTQKEVWQSSVEELKKVSEVKNQLEQLRFDLEKAERTGQFEEASKLKYSLIPELENQLKDLSFSQQLAKEDIAAVISRQKGIPTEKILQSKQDNILQLESYLKANVFGQDKALTEIAETLLTSHAGLTDHNRPLGSFLLKGPSGVGKTETAKSIARFLFDHEDALLRFDLSEYSEKHSVSKLIGAPAGYVGYDEGGQLTEAVRRKPYSVILFDEIEKAHADFADILLQILDEGRLTDNKGRTSNFRNTVILLTSNSKQVEKDFKPEVLGRLDSVLTYASLGSEVMHKLVARELELVNQRLKDKHAQLELTNEAKDLIAGQGFDPAYGARPLKSVFNSRVLRPLSKLVLSGELSGGTVLAEVIEGDIRLKSV